MVTVRQRGSQAERWTGINEARGDAIALPAVAR